MTKKYVYQTIDSKSTIDSVKEKLKKEKVKPLFRDTYRIKSNSHPYDVKEIEGSKPNEPINRREEWICKLSLGQTLETLGKVVDYQVPLKVRNHKNENEGRGKIDLLTINGDTLYLIEYKRLSNSENPLKAICEIYTYYRMLGGVCKNFKISNKVDKKFSENIVNPENIGIKKCKPIILLTEKDPGDKNEKNNVFSKFRNNKELLKFANSLSIECYYCSVNEKMLINKNSIKKFNKD